MVTAQPAAIEALLHCYSTSMSQTRHLLSTDTDRFAFSTQMGKRILIASIGSFGDVFPYIGLARELVQRGHEPILAMPAWYRDTVERDGLRFHPIRPDVDPHDRELMRQLMDPRRGSEFIVKWLMGPVLRDSFDDISVAAAGVDLILSHPITFAAPVVAEHLGIRWASSVLAPLSFFSSHELPVLSPAPWLKGIEKLPGASAAFVGLAKRMSRGWTKPVRALQRELGVAYRGNPIFEGQHSPHLVLALFSRVLARPQPDWPPNVHVTGAIAYNGAGAAGNTLSPALEEFLRAGEAPIVFTLGSSAVGAAGDFYKESAAALRQMRRRGVLLIGSHEENRPPEPLPDHVHIEPFAPHAAIFPRASAVVHQGGAGTLHQALAAGCPTLVVPHAHDQHDNAHRVRNLGTSRTLFPQHYRARRALKELETLLGDPTYRDRARAIAQTVSEEEGARNACDAIESIV